MTHLSMEMLLALRDRVSEPGTAAASDHLRECNLCQAGLGRLHQRAAQIRALPTLRPARDVWPAVAARVQKDRWRRRSMAGAGLVGLAMAASLAIVVLTERPAGSVTTVAAAQAEQIHQAQALSRELEKALNSYDPDARVLDGQTATIANAVEERIAEVDRAIELAESAERRGKEVNVLKLWQEKVGLLDALVNVHVSRASHVEF